MRLRGGIFIAFGLIACHWARLRYAGAMIRRLTWLPGALVPLVAVICTVGIATGGELQCPATISVDQKATEVPPGWTPSINGFKNELAMVTIYDGPPDQGASLVYDDQKTVGNTIIQTWNLAGNSHGSWMTCGYSYTAAQISQKVPADAKQCVVTYEGDVSLPGGQHPVRKAICSKQ